MTTTKRPVGRLSSIGIDLFSSPRNRTSSRSKGLAQNLTTRAPRLLPADRRPGYSQAYLKDKTQTIRSQSSLRNRALPTAPAFPEEEFPYALSGDGWCRLHRLAHGRRARPPRPRSRRARRSFYRSRGEPG